MASAMPQRNENINTTHAAADNNIFWSSWVLIAGNHENNKWKRRFLCLRGNLLEYFDTTPWEDDNVNGRTSDSTTATSTQQHRKHTQNTSSTATPSRETNKNKSSANGTASSKPYPSTPPKGWIRLEDVAGLCVLHSRQHDTNTNDTGATSSSMHSHTNQSAMKSGETNITGTDTINHRTSRDGPLREKSTSRRNNTTNNTTHEPDTSTSSPNENESHRHLDHYAQQCTGPHAAYHTGPAEIIFLSSREMWRVRCEFANNNQQDIKNEAKLCALLQLFECAVPLCHVKLAGFVVAKGTLHWSSRYLLLLSGGDVLIFKDPTLNNMRRHIPLATASVVQPITALATSGSSAESLAHSQLSKTFSKLTSSSSSLMSALSWPQHDRIQMRILHPLLPEKKGYIFGLDPVDGGFDMEWKRLSSGGSVNAAALSKHAVRVYDRFRSWLVTMQRTASDARAAQHELNTAEGCARVRRSQLATLRNSKESTYILSQVLSQGSFERTPAMLQLAKAGFPHTLRSALWSGFTARAIAEERGVLENSLTRLRQIEYSRPSFPNLSTVQACVYANLTMWSRDEENKNGSSSPVLNRPETPRDTGTLYADASARTRAADVPPRGHNTKTEGAIGGQWPPVTPERMRRLIDAHLRVLRSGGVSVVIELQLLKGADESLNALVRLAFALTAYSPNKGGVAYSFLLLPVLCLLLLETPSRNKEQDVFWILQSLFGVGGQGGGAPVFHVAKQAALNEILLARKVSKVGMKEVEQRADTERFEVKFQHQHTNEEYGGGFVGGPGNRSVDDMDSNTTRTQYVLPSRPLSEYHSFSGRVAVVEESHKSGMNDNININIDNNWGKCLDSLSLDSFGLGALVDKQVFMELLLGTFPTLYAHITQKSLVVCLETAVHSWLLSGFSMTLVRDAPVESVKDTTQVGELSVCPGPLDTTTCKRIWDLLMVHGPAVWIKAALAIISECSDAILEATDMASLVRALRPSNGSIVRHFTSDATPNSDASNVHATTAQAGYGPFDNNGTHIPNTTVDSLNNVVSREEHMANKEADILIDTAMNDDAISYGTLAGLVRRRRRLWANIAREAHDESRVVGTWLTALQESSTAVKSSISQLLCLLTNIREVRSRVDKILNEYNREQDRECRKWESKWGKHAPLWLVHDIALEDGFLQGKRRCTAACVELERRVGVAVTCAEKLLAWQGECVDAMNKSKTGLLELVNRAATVQQQQFSGTGSDWISPPVAVDTELVCEANGIGSMGAMSYVGSPAGDGGVSLSANPKSGHRVSETVVARQGSWEDDQDNSIIMGDGNRQGNGHDSNSANRQSSRHQTGTNDLSVKQVERQTQADMYVAEVLLRRSVKLPRYVQQCGGGRGRENIRYDHLSREQTNNSSVSNYGSGDGIYAVGDDNTDYVEDFCNEMPVELGALLRAGVFAVTPHAIVALVKKYKVCSQRNESLTQSCQLWSDALALATLDIESNPPPFANLHNSATQLRNHKFLKGVASLLVIPTDHLDEIESIHNPKPSPRLNRRTGGSGFIGLGSGGRDEEDRGLNGIGGGVGLGGNMEGAADEEGWMEPTVGPKLRQIDSDVEKLLELCRSVYDCASQLSLFATDSATDISTRLEAAFSPQRQKQSRFGLGWLCVSE